MLKVTLKDKSIKGNETSGKIYEIPEGTVIKDFLADIYGDKKFVAAKVNGMLQELPAELSEDAAIEPVERNSTIGYDMYKRSLVMLFLSAYTDVYGECRLPEVQYSLGNAYYIKIGSVTPEDEIQKIKEKMLSMVKADLKIEKSVKRKKEAIEYFEERGWKEKARLLHFRRTSTLNLYNIGDFYDYFYGYMVPSTGYLDDFDLKSYNEGILLIMPGRKGFDKKDIVYSVPEKLFDTLDKSENWGKLQNVSFVADLNDMIVENRQNDMILMQEALMEKQIADIAEMIVAGNKKIVLVAGPSSSGKTTFSRRLSIELRARGIKPHAVSLDDFFLERAETRIKENGEYDFESFETMDMELFEGHMTKLLNGETVEMPRFDFNVGMKKYEGNYLKLERDDVIIAEGIHALNPRMTRSLPRESRFNIYISALTQINIDAHNRISTSDVRLLRRLIRDDRTRGNDPAKTIRMWEDVQKGERENIFPFQEQSDVMFNSSIIYELPAIKIYAEPLLYRISEDAEEYYEAKRLLKFLDYILGMDISLVPSNSILREFVGGGCFDI